MGTRGLALTTIKYLPVCTSFLMWGHIAIHLFFGIHWYVAENVCGITIAPAVLLFLISHAFKYCWLHKAFVVYTFLISTMVDYNRIMGFNYLTLWEIVAVLIGGVLFATLFYKFSTFKSCDPTIIK